MLTQREADWGPDTPENIVRDGVWQMHEAWSPVSDPDDCDEYDGMLTLESARARLFDLADDEDGPSPSDCVEEMINLCVRETPEEAHARMNFECFGVPLGDY